MKRNVRLVLLFTFVFFITDKAAASAVAPADSTPVNKPWKISREQFLVQYGKDDTAKAVINYYFEQQHNKGQKKIWVNTLISATCIAVFAIIAANGPVGSVIVGAPFITAGFIFLAFAFHNALNMIYFSRKRLYRVLKMYFAGEKIPDSLRKDVYRKKHLL